MAHNALTDAQASAGKYKPAILCLHGGGTNALIFQIQMVRLQRILSPHFDFVYLDAPYSAEPGPGVIPTFEGCGPYFRWLQPSRPGETPDSVKRLISRAADEQVAKDGRGFVGIMGFSQGGRMASGLLLEQQLDKGLDWGDGLRFGVFCNSTSPPLTSGLMDDEKMERISVPTLHAVGLKDPWGAEGRELWSVHSQPEKAVLMEFDVDHRLPALHQDTLKLASEILRVHRETSGER